MTIQENIRAILREKGQRQRDAAARAGMSPAVLSNIVRGRRKVYADEVEPIARALGVTIEELFAREADSIHEREG